MTGTTEREHMAQIKRYTEGKERAPIRNQAPEGETERVKNVQLAQLNEWMEDTGCQAIRCGCWVEHDGYCEHGNPSYFIYYGLI